MFGDIVNGTRTLTKLSETTLGSTFTDLASGNPNKVTIRNDIPDPAKRYDPLKPPVKRQLVQAVFSETIGEDSALSGRSVTLNLSIAGPVNLTAGTITEAVRSMIGFITGTYPTGPLSTNMVKFLNGEQ